MSQASVQYDSRRSAKTACDVERARDGTVRPRDPGRPHRREAEECQSRPMRVLAGAVEQFLCNRSRSTSTSTRPTAESTRRAVVASIGGSEHNFQSRQHVMRRTSMKWPLGQGQICPSRRAAELRRLRRSSGGRNCLFSKMRATGCRNRVSALNGARMEVHRRVAIGYAGSRPHRSARDLRLWAALAREDQTAQPSIGAPPRVGS
jgi:hypothetical protein